MIRGAGRIAGHWFCGRRSTRWALLAGSLLCLAMPTAAQTVGDAGPGADGPARFGQVRTPDASPGGARSPQAGGAAQSPALTAELGVTESDRGLVPGTSRDGTATAAGPLYIPDVSRWLPKAANREALSNSLQILILLTLLTVAPSLLLLMTCFARMLVVLVLLRQALGTQQLPPSQVLIGLALFLTLLVMAPTWERMNANAVQPYMDGRLGQMEALAIAGGELRTFMFSQIKAAANEPDVYLMYEYAKKRTVPADEVLDERDVPMTALIPAFILSELKAAFVIGFRIYLPFLVIDMVIATVLVSMGMMMLPPVLISLPFKLLLFVLADGWRLVAGSLMASVA